MLLFLLSFVAQFAVTLAGSGKNYLYRQIR